MRRHLEALGPKAHGSSQRAPQRFVALFVLEAGQLAPRVHLSMCTVLCLGPKIYLHLTRARKRQVLWVGQ